jgi:hypothetical protein
MEMELTTRSGLLAILMIVIVGANARAWQDLSLSPAPFAAVERPGFRLFDSARLESLADVLLAPLSREEDPDGPISTDRPSFTPANTVVPRGRLQFESGYTFTHDLTDSTRIRTHDLPELAMRAGITDRVEFRTFWLGQTESREISRIDGTTRIVSGPSDMEIGFKTQLITSDRDRRWLPVTALITSVYAPTGGDSPFSSGTVDPYVNLLYGWSLTESLRLAGSVGYQSMRDRNRSDLAPADRYERFNHSLITYYSFAPRATLYYEWYGFTYTNGADNRATHFMDGGLLYRPTPNIQLDARVGFGLGDRPDDLFTGVGLSVRF